MWTEEETYTKKESRWIVVGVFLLLCGFAVELWMYTSGLLQDLADLQSFTSSGSGYFFVFVFMAPLIPGWLVINEGSHALPPASTVFRILKYLGIITLLLAGVCLFIYLGILFQWLPKN
ncbi:MAG: hypothetical protein WC379_14600 [Methanoregula sp.]|jgi:hypothetical protein